MGRNFKKLKNNGGFTIVEFLTVLTIIAIFSGFLFPIGNQIVRKVRMSKDAHNLRQIALSYQQLIQNDVTLLNKFKDVHSINDWAITLAQLGGLNNASCYVSALANESISDNKVIVDKFKNTLDDFSALSLSWICLTPISTNLPLETTPLLYSKGLNINTGLWEEDSLYGTDGGYIVFLDGHVKFFKTLKDQLISYKTGKPTSYIQESVPSNSEAYDTQGRLW